MRKRYLWLSIAIAVFVLIGSVAWIGINSQTTPRYHADVVESLSQVDLSSQFKRATEIRKFKFPDDFGPHQGFQTEWWYYTGNLQDQKGHHFGYQLTIFRRALDNQPLIGTSKWRTNQVYFAHFALTDVAQQRFQSFERYSRGAMGLAGAQAEPYKVWLEDWQVEQNGDQVELKAAEKDIQLNLTLVSTKPVVLEGDRGLSQKGKEKGNASYYFSQTRLKTHGSISTVEGEYQVAGFSWLDREWSTSALEKNQSGWDWFSIQLNDQREIMLYQIRTTSDKPSPFSSGTYIDSSGQSYPLDLGDFNIQPTSEWKSPKTGVVYPASWVVSLPKYQLELVVVPYLKDQEHRHSFLYWEGAVRIQSAEVSGNGYVELTGYDRSLAAGK